MTLNNTIRKELKLLIENTQFDLKGYIEKRLQQYTVDKNSDFEDLKSYFKNNADIENPTNAQEEEEAYLKLMDKFLTSSGY